ncbi:MAG: nitroreductase family protein [Anaerolinea sp.]|nr:nitroreductase family protein [Anaerolinea sp.]MCC6975893.1 nitroreductase family protein [Anaerolineae bacterium]CAG1009472.1 3-hydroxypropanoate dehydrogenase [Anaerolineae bacterium]
MATIDHIIEGRRSIRRYGDRPVEVDTIQRLLELAAWAPSAHNRQPWRFVVLAQPENRERLAAQMAARLRADLEHDELPPDQIERDVSRSYARITEAPAAVLVCMSMEDMDTYPDPKRARAEHLMAAQSVAMAVQNLLLAAHAQGLGGCWMCAPLFCPETVQKALNLPLDWEPQALITLGYPEKERSSSREPVALKTMWR